MGKRITQKEIMKDILDGLDYRHGLQGWRFRQEKVPGVKHAIRGDNKRTNHHMIFAVPMLLIQESNMEYYTAIDCDVFRPIRKTINNIKANPPDTINKKGKA